MYPLMLYSLQVALSIKLIVAIDLRGVKTDPFKTFISQPLRNANFLGPGGCEMKFLNGPIKNN
jgi:hypothetical protein